MKARSKELLDRAVAVAAIEIYIKPDFLYREEAFAVLAINGWELLLKAKWLADHNNKVSTLYVRDLRLREQSGGNRPKLPLTAMAEVHAAATMALTSRISTLISSASSPNRDFT